MSDSHFSIDIKHKFRAELGNYRKRRPIMNDLKSYQNLIDDLDEAAKDPDSATPLQALNDGAFLSRYEVTQEQVEELVNKYEVKL